MVPPTFPGELVWSFCYACCIPATNFKDGQMHQSSRIEVLVKKKKIHLWKQFFPTMHLKFQDQLRRFSAFCTRGYPKLPLKSFIISKFCNYWSSCDSFDSTRLIILFLACRHDRSPWSFVVWLSDCFGDTTLPSGTYFSLRMSLILSLASLYDNVS